MSKQHDNVNNPQHYAGSTSLECIEVMRLIFGTKAVYYFCLCNSFKYMWRYKNKNGEEDLRKAKWYLDYVLCDIELNKGHVPEEICSTYGKIHELYTHILNKKEN